jgi:hypothetical protein
MASPVFREIIDHPNAWTPDGGVERFWRHLSEAELAALDDLIAKTRDVDPVKVTREQFSDPVIDALADEMREIILNGAGVVILKGVTPDRYSEEDMKRLYWGLGTHLGRGLPQSRQMEMLGLVQEEEANPMIRGYRSSAALGMHTDAFEIVGLMCVRRAEEGGESSLASALTMHNKILSERPELLEALYEGYYFVLQELQFTDRPTTAEKIPVFSNKDGVVSVNAASSYMRHAAELRKEPFPADLDEALKYFDQVANREDVRAEFLLDDGDVMLWNNYTHLHSRRSFKNSTERKRLLLRLWLEVENGRDVQPDYALRGRSFRWINEQVPA